MSDQIEVDPSKTCVQRYEHRTVKGEDRPEGTMCPACWPQPEPESES